MLGPIFMGSTPDSRSRSRSLLKTGIRRQTPHNHTLPISSGLWEPWEGNDLGPPVTLPCHSEFGCNTQCHGTGSCIGATTTAAVP